MELSSLNGTTPAKPALAPLQQSMPQGNIRNQLTFQESGYQEAGKMNGSLAGLKICLQKIYSEFRESTRMNSEQQQEQKMPYRIKIEDYKGHNTTLMQRISRIREEELPAMRSKTHKLREEFSRIRQHPHEIIGDDAGKASFVVGCVILFFLTIYLLVFYSSASFSAFFKEFTQNDLGIANSIFDARAIPLAWHHGFTELLLILTIPFVFLGLGYLIHKLKPVTTNQRYIYAGIIVITFLFDGILAYQITKRIDHLDRAATFQDSHSYTLTMALSDVNFWMIIFAGFIVYLIWGFVFDLTIEAYSHMNKIKIALEQKQLHITESESAERDLETQIDKMQYTINENNKEINKLTTILHRNILPRESQHDIYSFLSGWLAWMNGSNLSKEDLNTAQLTGDEFVKTIQADTDVI